MYHLRKITLLLAVFTLLFSISCSKDDEETTLDLTEVDFTFDASNPPIDQTLITNLISSDDVNAGYTGSLLSTANFMTVWLSYFSQTQGAAQTSVPISTCGGDALVYTYTTSNGTESFTIAYQLCETSSKYIFQVFFAQNGGAFEQFIYAEESKGDLRQGLMELYITDLTDEGTSTEPVLTYTWNENVDGSLVYEVSDPGQDFLLEVLVNADNSGNLSYSSGGILYYEATWNASGTVGTYTYYDSEGVVTESGSWPA